jgi:hypothetical protein
VSALKSTIKPLIESGEVKYANPHDASKSVRGWVWVYPSEETYHKHIEPLINNCDVWELGGEKLNDNEILSLWKCFLRVPGDRKITEEWDPGYNVKPFPAGTYRYTIWEWFENKFGINAIDWLVGPKSKEIAKLIEVDNEIYGENTQVPKIKEEELTELKSSKIHKIVHVNDQFIQNHSNEPLWSVIYTSKGVPNFFTCLTYDDAINNLEELSRMANIEFAQLVFCVEEIN